MNQESPSDAEHTNDTEEGGGSPRALLMHDNNNNTNTEPRWSLKHMFSCFDSFLENFRELKRSPRYLIVLYVISFMDSLAYFAFSYALIMHLGVEMGLPDSLAGIFYGIFGVCISVSTLILGFVADSMGPRNAMCVSAALSFVARLAMAYAVLGHATWLSATLLFAVIAPSMALMAPTIPTAIKRYTTKRTITIGTSIFYGIMNGAAFLATPIIDVLRINNHGNVMLLPPYALLIALTGILHIPIFFAALFGIKDIDLKEDYTLGPVAVKAPNRTFMERVKDMTKNRDFWRAVVIVICQIGVKSSFRYFDALYLPYVMRAYQDAKTFPYMSLLALNPIIVIATTVTGAITMFTDLFHPVTSMIIGAFIGGVAPLWMAIGPFVWNILFYVIFTSVGEVIWSPVSYSFLISLTSDGEEGAWMALAGMPMFLAKMLTGTLTGTLMAAFCPNPGTLCKMPPIPNVDGPRGMSPTRFSQETDCVYVNGTLAETPAPAPPQLWGDIHQCYSLGIWGIIGATTSTSFIALLVVRRYISNAGREDITELVELDEFNGEEDAGDGDGMNTQNIIDDF